jgi:GNAT superfamily N-acetyltransferase
MIRMAQEKDVEDVLNHCADFWLHTQFSEEFDREHCRVMVEYAHKSGALVVVDADGEVVGFSAAVYSPSLGNPVLTGVELAWWVSPEHRKGRNGIALLQFMEQLAKERGVKYWTMAAMMSSMPEEICALYERLGYSKAEISYTKVIK